MTFFCYEQRLFFLFLLWRCMVYFCFHLLCNYIYECTYVLCVRMYVPSQIHSPSSYQSSNKLLRVEMSFRYQINCSYQQTFLIKANKKTTKNSKHNAKERQRTDSRDIYVYVRYGCQVGKCGRNALGANGKYKLKS